MKRREWAVGIVGQGPHTHHLWRLDGGRWTALCGSMRHGAGRLPCTANGDTDVTCHNCRRLMKVNESAAGVLSGPQVEVVRRLAMTGGNRAIADDLDISRHTVRNHLADASEQLGVYASRTGLLVEALRRGEVALEELVAPAHVLNEETHG